MGLPGNNSGTPSEDYKLGMNQSRLRQCCSVPHSFDFFLSKGWETSTLDRPVLPERSRRTCDCPPSLVSTRRRSTPSFVPNTFALSIASRASLRSIWYDGTHQPVDRF